MKRHERIDPHAMYRVNLNRPLSYKWKNAVLWTMSDYFESVEISFKRCRELREAKEKEYLDQGDRVAFEKVSKTGIFEFHCRSESGESATILMDPDGGVEFEFSDSVSVAKCRTVCGGVAQLLEGTVAPTESD